VEYRKLVLINLWILLMGLSLQTFAKDNFTPKKMTLAQCFKLHKNLYTGNLPTKTPAVAKVMIEKEKELKGLNYLSIVPWQPQKRKMVERFLVEKFDADFLAQKLPAFDKTQKLGAGRLAVADIRWSQVACRNMSQDGKYSVVSNAHAIKNGTLDIKILPTIRVWRDDKGRVWTLDHRRLAAIKLSGVVKEIPVEFVSEEVVKAQKFKFGTLNDGKSIFIYQDEKGKKADLAVVLMDGVK
jgi:hypothetical protein